MTFPIQNEFRDFSTKKRGFLFKKSEAKKSLVENETH
jgi:hypothetical protein